MGALTPPLPQDKPVTRLRTGFALVAVCFFVAGLALIRLLFEGLFPTWGWLGRPFPALALGFIAGGLGATGAILISRRRGLSLIVAALPLLLNLVWLVDPAVNLERGRFLFGASLWLAAVLVVYAATGDTDRRWRWLGPLLMAVALLPVYLVTMSHSVGAADTFEFQVVAPQLGIAHPTGYPLYLLLGKLFSLLPVGAMAWRLNLASAVFAVLAVAVVFRLGLDLLRRPLPALAGAVTLSLVPIFWGQAIIAEVYTLHALVVAVALWLMVELTADRASPASDRGPTTNEQRLMMFEGPSPAEDRKRMVGLAFVLGLGLTNHLTTVFLLPPAALAIALNLAPALLSGRRSTVDGLRSEVSRRRSLVLLLLQLAIAFALPLLLYAYLPLRWAAVNGEPMGVSRFVDWVIGGRFQGALQWGAWLRDPARGAIVARLLIDAWGWFYVMVATVGLAWLFARRWRVALVLLVAAAGFTFYALNYYVPDLAVFLVPTHVVIAMWVAAGVAGVLESIGRVFPASADSRSIGGVIFLIAVLPALLLAGNRWSGIDQSSRDGGEPWARGVLSLPLARRAAILADSEKIAPLYYLQRAEQLRPDLDIMVLPDEAAYRAELDFRLATGQTVYLARYLPGLAGVYHLRSAGPLVEASRQALEAVPEGVTEADQAIGPLRLRGYSAEPVAAADPGSAGLALYWTLDRPLADGTPSPVLYLRWAKQGEEVGEPVVIGSHPVNDAYPVNAWRAGEIVVDYHLLPLPDIQCGETSCLLDVEVAVAPRFTPAAELEWRAVTTFPVTPRPGPVGQARRMTFDGFALDGLDFPATARPGSALLLRYSGFGEGTNMDFILVPTHAVSSLVIPARRAPEMNVESEGSTTYTAVVEPATEEGPHALVAYYAGELEASCGWLQMPTTGCVVAEIDIRGAALPQGAANFDDKIALLDIALEPDGLAPGGQLPVTLTWQGLAQMNEDYTVFVQVLDAADRVVGQVDAWPVQGTRPTSGWQPGEVITDPFMVQLDPDLPPGDYRVITGLYLLATGQRLPMVDETGNIVDDKVEVKLEPTIR